MTLAGDKQLRATAIDVSISVSPVESMPLSLRTARNESVVTVSLPAIPVVSGSQDPTLLAVAVYEGKLAESIARSAVSSDLELGDLKLASSLVDVTLLDGPQYPLGVGGSVNVTLTVKELDIGESGSCAVPSLLDAVGWSAQDEKACVSGCCVDSWHGRICECSSDDIRGTHCEQQLKCRVIRTLDDLSSHACMTYTEGSNTVICSCNELGGIAVFLARSVPTSNLKHMSSVERWKRWQADSGAPFLVLLLLASTYALAFAAAYYADRSSLYVSSAPPWLSGLSFTARLIANVRVHSTLLRAFNMVPGFTKYTHVQAMHILYSAMTVSMVASLLFAGVNQCSDVKTLVASVCSASLCTLTSGFGRVLFKWSNLSGVCQQALRAKLRHNKHVRLKALALNGLSPLSPPSAQKPRELSLPWKRSRPVQSMQPSSNSAAITERPLSIPARRLPLLHAAFAVSTHKKRLSSLLHLQTHGENAPPSPPTLHSSGSSGLTYKEELDRMPTDTGTPGAVLIGGKLPRYSEIRQFSTRRKLRKRFLGSREGLPNESSSSRCSPRGNVPHDISVIHIDINGSKLKRNGHEPLTRCLELSTDQLIINIENDEEPVLGFYVSTHQCAINDGDDNGEKTESNVVAQRSHAFVPVLCVGARARWLGSCGRCDRLQVWCSSARLMHICGSLSPSQIIRRIRTDPSCRQEYRWPLLEPFMRGWRQQLAWSINGLFVFALALTFTDLLLVSAKWSSSVRSSFCLSIAQSLIVMDLLKAVLITVVSPEMLARTAFANSSKAQQSRRVRVLRALLRACISAAEKMM